MALEFKQNPKTDYIGQILDILGDVSDCDLTPLG
jgi:hypothetical protein